MTPTSDQFFKGDYSQLMRPRKRSEFVGAARATLGNLHQILTKGQDVKAILLAGDSGVGKNSLSRYWGAFSICIARKSPEDDPCGQCGPCNAAFTAGDTWGVNPWPDGMYHEFTHGMEWSLEKIKNAIDGLPGYGRIYREKKNVVVFDELQKMNVILQQSLLKYTEDGIPNTLIFINTSHIEKAIPQIKNRCRVLIVPSPTRDDLVSFLRLAASKGQVPWEDDALKMLSRAFEHPKFQEVYNFSFRSAASFLGGWVCSLEEGESLSVNTLRRELKPFGLT